MTTSLYEQAIADAKALREVAEQNAKNAIIESITPKLREMIDKQILGEDSDVDGDIFEEGVLDSQVEKDLSEAVEESPAAKEQDVFESLRRLEGEFTSSRMNEVHELNQLVENSELGSLTKSQQVLLDQLAATVQIHETYEKNNERLTALQEHVAKMGQINVPALRAGRLKSFLANIGIADKSADALQNIFENRMQNSGFFTTEIQSMTDTLGKIKKEINEMKRSLRELLSEEVVDLRVRVDLGDVDVDLSEEDIEVELSDAEMEDEAEEEREEAEELEADADAKEDDAVEVDLDVEDEVSEEQMLEISADELREHIREMVAQSLNEEEEPLSELEDIEAAMEEGEGVEEGYYGMEEGDYGQMEEEEADEGMDPMMESLDDDTVLEISESMLRDELAKMLSESADEEAEELVENNTQENVNAEYAATIDELQGQLAEMNLFNAKLLYTNKLLLNDDLSRGQKVKAIDSLDEARNLREVKLLYKGLTSSANNKKKSVNESASRIAGSASRATRPSSTLVNESAENNRWSVLAGLK